MLSIKPQDIVKNVSIDNLEFLKKAIFFLTQRYSIYNFKKGKEEILMFKKLES